jgi:hypothetical protein
MPQRAESISSSNPCGACCAWAPRRICSTCSRSSIPADLAQIFAELPERERHATFNVLVERNGKLAMETLSELGPERGAELLALRSAEKSRVWCRKFRRTTRPS